MTETTTLTLTDFLLARIADDESVARAASPGPWRHFGGQRSHDLVVASDLQHVAAAAEVFDARPWVPLDRSDAAHIARHNPARVLAECASKRAQVDHLIRFMEGDYAPWNEGQLQIMAAVYADHPDYDPSWAL